MTSTKPRWAGALSRATPTMIGQQLHGSFAEALEDADVRVMTKPDVRRLLLGDPRISAPIAETLGRRNGELEQKFTDAVSSRSRSGSPAPWSR